MNNLAFQEEVWEELLDGKIVAMSPRPGVNHNIVAGNICHIFGNFAARKASFVFSTSVYAYLTKKDRVMPDVKIVCDKEIIKEDGIHGAPDLIVEVLSPSTAKNDRGYKKKLYEKCGVKEYWLVDIESRSIEVYLLKDGQFDLDEVYSIFPDYLIGKMTEEEKSKIAKEFKTSLFPELTIVLEEVFENLI